jgi:tetratricopeptide (TPR) repeat protein
MARYGHIHFRSARHLTPPPYRGDASVAAVVVLVIVVIALLIPLMIWTSRVGARRSVRSQGLDWTRGMAEGAKLVLEGTGLHRDAKFAEAIALYNRALALDADDPDALVARAATYHRLGRLDEALADYDRAIALKGTTPEALNNRGCVHRDRGDLERALTDVEDALRLAPTDAVAHVSLAEVQAARGEWEAAVSALERAIELDESWRAYARTADALAPLRKARPEASAFRT